MPTYEGLRLKLLTYNRKIFGSAHRKKLTNKRFTIISNNCWGGEVYEYYNLQKQSPTVGLFFMASDYLIFLEDLKGFLSAELIFINPNESKWVNDKLICSDKRFGSYPIGKLISNGKSIEIFFLHYKNEKEAKEKWNRRCKRISWNKMLIKFNDQNGCDSKSIDKFIGLKYDNKIFFTAKRWKKENEWRRKLSYYYYIHQMGNNGSITASHEPFGNHKAKITDILNSL